MDYTVIYRRGGRERFTWIRTGRHSSTAIAGAYAIAANLERAGYPAFVVHVDRPLPTTFTLTGCVRCGAELESRGPCCEGPCVHEAERSDLCETCENRERAEFENSPCPHQVGQVRLECLRCMYSDDGEEAR